MHWHTLWADCLQWVSLHPTAAYLVIFLISFSESLALVGLIVPGTVMMIGIGALAGGGALSLKMTLWMAMAGAIAGDGVSYWLGRHYHQGIKRLWPFRSHPQLLAKGEEFFHRHGGKSVFLGRFVGPVRPVIPIIAGMLDMPPRHFLLVNILSAVGWAFAYLMPGVLLGGSLTLAGAVSSRLSSLLLLLLILLWSVYWLSKKAFLWLGRLEPRIERLLLPLLCLSLGLAGWLFLGVLEDVVTLDPLVQADQAIYHLLQSLRTPWGDQLMVAVTELGDSLMNIFVICGVLLVLLGQRLYRPAAYWLSAGIGGAGLVQLFKWLVHKPRPIAIYHGVSSWGFPSGHSTMSVVLFGFLALLLARNLPLRLRWIPFATAIGASLLIAFSRLYLGAHWFSDVVGGFSLGWAWVTLLGIFYLRRQADPFSIRGPVVALATVLLLAGGWHIGQRHEQDMTRYQFQRQLKTITLPAWMTEGWQQLPGWRMDLFGEREQPLTIQWAGDPTRLSDWLRQQGWRPIERISVRTLLNVLLPHPDLQTLPLLPLLADGEREQLLMVRDNQTQRQVLRLWPSDFVLEGGTPILVGSLETERAEATAGLLTLPRGQGDFSLQRNQIEKDVAGRFDFQRVDRYRALENKSINQTWDGQVTLVWDKNPPPH